MHAVVGTIPGAVMSMLWRTRRETKIALARTTGLPLAHGDNAILPRGEQAGHRGRNLRQSGPLGRAAHPDENTRGA
jgi:hypothetical protein